MVQTYRNGNRMIYQTAYFAIRKKHNFHLFNNCKAVLKRYEWRHNSIIKTIMNNLIMVMSEGFKFYDDINGFENTNRLFKSSRPNELKTEMYLQRPSIVILERRRITIIELNLSI